MAFRLHIFKSGGVAYIILCYIIIRGHLPSHCIVINLMTKGQAILASAFPFLTLF